MCAETAAYKKTLARRGLFSPLRFITTYTKGESVEQPNVNLESHTESETRPGGFDANPGIISLTV